MTVAAGNLSLALDLFKTTLANSSNFQTWVGAANATEALRSIYKEGLPPPDDGRTHDLAELESYRPYALIATDTFARNEEAVGSSTEFDQSGSLLLKLVRDVPVGIRGDIQEVGLTFENEVGQILDDLCTLAGVNPYLAIKSIDIPEPWYRTTEDDLDTQGDAQAVDVEVTY